MNVASLPLVGHLYLPLLLTSLIVGLIILILLDKRKNEGKERVLGKNYTTVSPVNNGVCGGEKSPGDTVTPCDPETENPSAHPREQIGRGKVIVSHSDHDKPSTHKVEDLLESTSGCSSSEEDTTRPKRKVSHTRKHSCSGAKTCSNKKTVSEVIIVADISDDQLRVSSEDLAERFTTGGLTCTTRASLEVQQSLLNTEPSQLSLFLVTSYDKCERLLDTVLKIRETSDSTLVFTYSILCLTETSSRDICESAERLSVALSDLGGTRWLPLTCITYTGYTQNSSVLSSCQYTKKVLDKIKKISKKCCGTSCSSKMEVDIEDLAASLLPIVTPVKT
ncbi:uncharacterized protein LOC121858651 [Homarus americanus]|uniref:Uncharacterized protein n=1 Tax=Homarus americanus TaxID=6706 RepID=A0A8J5TGS7_HOMAM|nr:uncharacterized protein LOC121858651 [Homarus americanus]KAG7175004.1 hypothetical protein Hamer_G015213 [Homarus americanus]